MTETLLTLQIWIGLIAGSAILLILAVGLPIAAVTGVLMAYRNVRTWAGLWLLAWLPKEQREMLYRSFQWDISQEERELLAKACDRVAAGIIRRSREVAIGPFTELKLGGWYRLTNDQKVCVISQRGSLYGARLAGEDIWEQEHWIRADGVLMEQPSLRVIEPCDPADEVEISSGPVVGKDRRTVPQLIEALASNDRSTWRMSIEDRGDLVEALRAATAKADAP